MTFKYSSYTDSGTPQFTHVDDELSIICAPGDRGRWLCDSQEPAIPGQKLILKVQVQTKGAEDFCASIFITWWKNEAGFILHSSQFVAEICGTQEIFRQIEHKFTVPEGVRPPRIDLRSWSAAGTSHFKALQITADDEPPVDPPDPPIVPPGCQLTIDLSLHTIIWRVTASEESITALRIPKEVSS